MLKRLEIFEHQSVKVGVAHGRSAAVVTQSEFEALARFNDATCGKFFTLGHKSFTATSFVGYVEVGRLAIEILPKADRDSSHPDARPWRDGLLEMLRVAAGLKLQSPNEASQTLARSSLLEIVAMRFVGEIERLLHEGLAKGYRDVEANLATCRGRLVFASHLRENVARADRFYVRNATYERDVPVNQVLGLTLDVLSQLAVSPAVASRVAACRAVFPEVESVRLTTSTFERLRLSRSTARYRDALALARMILEHHAPQLRAGRVAVFALLFEMNVLWERYVAALFRRAAGPGITVATQESRTFWKPAGHSRRSARPDIVVRKDATGEVILVADTKWKVPRDGAPSDHDLRQMFVYNELFKAPRAFLLYPRGGEASGRGGGFHGRAHGCESVHLGVVDAGGWATARVRAQIGGLLADAAVDASAARSPGAVSGVAAQSA